MTSSFQKIKSGVAYGEKVTAEELGLDMGFKGFGGTIQAMYVGDYVPFAIGINYSVGGSRWNTNGEKSDRPYLHVNTDLSIGYAFRLGSDGRLMIIPSAVIGLSTYGQTNSNIRERLVAFEVGGDLMCRYAITDTFGIFVGCKAVWQNGKLSYKYKGHNSGVSEEVNVMNNFLSDLKLRGYEIQPRIGISMNW